MRHDTPKDCQEAACTNPDDSTQNEGIHEEAAATADNYPSFRWRLVAGKLPLYERHLRSLKSYNISAPLQAWIRSRLEWTLDNLACEEPDGVLCIFVESDESVTIRVEAPCADKHPAADSLVWRVHNAVLTPCALPLSACNTLVRDLAHTLKIPVSDSFNEGLAADDSNVSESFLVDDEHGITTLDEKAGPVTQRMIECFNKLWSSNK